MPRWERQLWPPTKGEARRYENNAAKRRFGEEKEVSEILVRIFTGSSDFTVSAATQQEIRTFSAAAPTFPHCPVSFDEHYGISTGWLMWIWYLCFKTQIKQWCFRGLMTMVCCKCFSLESSLNICLLYLNPEDVSFQVGAVWTKKSEENSETPVPFTLVTFWARVRVLIAPGCVCAGLSGGRKRGCN